ELGPGEVGDLLEDREQRIRAPPRPLGLQLGAGHVEVQLRDAEAQEIEAVLHVLVPGRESGRFLTAPAARHRGPPTPPYIGADAPVNRPRRPSRGTRPARGRAPPPPPAPSGRRTPVAGWSSAGQF